jgi:hypothetical protein
MFCRTGKAQRTRQGMAPKSRTRSAPTASFLQGYLLVQERIACAEVAYAGVL